MSNPHHAPAGETTESHPLKLAIIITVGAFALILGIVMLAYFAVGSRSVGTSVGNANTPEAIAARIAPVTTLAVDTTKAAAQAPPLVATIPTKATAPVVAMAIPAAAAPAAAGGESVYKAACVACHGAGIAGAPKLGDKAAWSTRTAQGKTILYDHAIRGYQGKAGVMPAKGGNTALADADVKAAVDYMVSASK